MNELTRVEMTGFYADGKYATLSLDTVEGSFNIVQHIAKPQYAVYFYNDNSMEWTHINDYTTLSEAVIAVERYEYVESDECYTCDTADEPLRVRDYVEPQYFGDE